jgi:hypothetical protein
VGSRVLRRDAGSADDRLAFVPKEVQMAVPLLYGVMDRTRDFRSSYD